MRKAHYAEVTREEAVMLLRTLAKVKPGKKELGQPMSTTDLLFKWL